MSLYARIRKELPSFTLDVEIEATAETLGLLGASGSGKSMTLRCIAGVERPDSGRIVVSGTTFFDSERGIDLSPQQRKTALLFQNYQLFPTMTVAENIAAGMDRSVDRPARDARVDSLLEFFHLEGFGNQYPARLSGGQQQRVALARMLAAEPGILMLDEPFSALDEHLKASFEQELLDTFDQFDGTILYVSHDIDEAFRFSDRIAVLDGGRISDIGPAERIVSHPSTAAALRLSGCKNISPARRLSEHTLYAEDWRIEMRSSQPVPENLAFVGIHAFHVRRAAGGDAVNVFDAVAARVSDSRFERTVLLSLGDQQEHAEVSRYIHWKIDKLAVPADKLVGRGDRVRISLPEDSLHLVCR